MNNNDFYIGMGHNPNPNVPDIPEGLSMALHNDTKAREAFQKLNDTQKSDLIHYIQSNNQTGFDAKNKIEDAMEELRGGKSHAQR